jgi:hypothetical protein
MRRIIDFLKVRIFAYPLIMLMAIPLARLCITHSEWGKSYRPKDALDMIVDAENRENPRIFPMQMSGLVPFYSGDGTIDIAMTPRVIRGISWMFGISGDDIEEERKKQAKNPRPNKLPIGNILIVPHSRGAI